MRGKHYDVTKSGPTLSIGIAKQTRPATVTVFFLPHKNAQETDLGNLSDFTFISCGHFDEIIFLVPLKMEVGLSRQSSGVGRGWLPLRKI